MQEESPIIDVGKYAGLRIDQLPLSYLRWMLMQDFPKEWLAVAKKKVDASAYSDDYINVSRHAMDMFSIRFLGHWQQSFSKRDSKKGKNNGIATYVAKLAQEAWENGKDISKHRHQDDGIVKEWSRIRFVYKVSKEFPDYKEVITIM